MFQDESAEPTEPTSLETGRNCHILSTGAILLADIIPSLTIKIIVPFLPFYIQWVDEHDAAHALKSYPRIMGKQSEDFKCVANVRHKFKVVDLF